MSQTIEAPRRIQRKPNVIPMEGLRFGRYLVLSQGETVKSGVKWLCRCDCGTTREVSGSSLRNRGTQSCGCLAAENALKRIKLLRNTNEPMINARTKHGHKRQGKTTPTYKTWFSMIQRCEFTGHKSYANYGGRGIRVCQEWKDFLIFLKDMGERPDGMTLDRVDNSGDYEPSNCRWATLKTQGRNRRDNVRLKVGDVELTLIEWEERTGIRANTIGLRVMRGLPPEECILPPTPSKSRMKNGIK